MAANEYARVTDVTYLGYVHGTLAALQRMLPRDRGTIVQVGSALAYRSIPLQSAYCGAKHAMIGFTDSLRSELIHDGSRVRVTVVQHARAQHTPVQLVRRLPGGHNRFPDIRTGGQAHRRSIGPRIIGGVRSRSGPPPCSLSLARSWCRGSWTATWLTALGMGR